MNDSSIPTSAEVIVVGGGLVGMAVAYGLAKAGTKTLVLDQGDDAFRASRGNFGLVWVQGKGFDRLEYSRWTRSSALAWAGLAEQIAAASNRSILNLMQRLPAGLAMQCFRARGTSMHPGAPAQSRAQFGPAIPLFLYRLRRPGDLRNKFHADRRCRF